MLLTLLFVTIAFALFTLGTIYMMRWASGYISRDVETHLRAAERVVNEGRIPDEWLVAYRRQASAMRAAGKSDLEMEKVAQRARSHIQKQIDNLMYFFSKTNVTDSDVTRRTILATLKQERERVAGQSWQALLAEPVALPKSESDP